MQRCWCPYVTDPCSKCDFIDGLWAKGNSVYKNSVIHRYQMDGAQWLSHRVPSTQVFIPSLYLTHKGQPLTKSFRLLQDCTQTETPSVPPDFLFPPGPFQGSTAAHTGLHFSHTCSSSPSSCLPSVTAHMEVRPSTSLLVLSLSISYVFHLCFLRRCQSTLLMAHGVSALFHYTGRIALWSSKALTGQRHRLHLHTEQ